MVCLLHTAVQAAFKALPQALQAINGQALAVGLLALACCYLTPKKISRIVPGSLLGLITGTLAAVYAQLGPACHPHSPQQALMLMFGAGWIMVWAICDLGRHTGS